MMKMCEQLSYGQIAAICFSSTWKDQEILVLNDHAFKSLKYL
jgi:hypothetical protein